MTDKLKWRLTKLPSVDEITTLLDKKIISQEEAKDILFNKETETERDIESYKEEVKFLKEVIEKLGSRDKIIPIVTEYIYHYNKQPFYQPYYYYTTCGSQTLEGGNIALCGGSGSGNSATITNCSFSSIVS